MVGRLVEQQDVGVRRQHARQRGAARFAAGNMSAVLLAGEPELLEHVARHMRIVVRAEPGLGVVARRRKAGEIRLLRQIADGRAGLAEYLAFVELDHARDHLQQRGLARAVAPDQAHPLALGQSELGAGEQRRAAEGQRNVAKLEEGRGGHCRETNKSCAPLTPAAS